MTRTGTVERATSESKVAVRVELDRVAPPEISTGVHFFDHMLAQLGKHGGFSLSVRTEGDLHIDAHHTVEDTTIALGDAFALALGDKSGIARYGDALIPMDEVLVQAAVDLSGRPYCVHVEPEGMTPMIGPDYPTSLTRHVMETFAFHARIALHIRVLASGRDAHHIVEGQFKALARALRTACAPDGSALGVPSTKGSL